MDKIAPVSSAPRLASVAEVTKRTTDSTSASRDGRAEERFTAPEHPVSIATFVDAIIAQGPPIDLEKVTRVRAEIARGTLEINHDGIAAAILELRVRDV